MSGQPKNYFESLAGKPVLYDRLHDHYGKTGIPYQFHCTAETQATLELLFQDIFERSTRLGAPLRILSAGAWVSKPGQHGEGRAFDLDAIHWERTALVALNQPAQKPLYLAVQALCLKHCGTVLGYDYNAKHRDHLHVDTGRPVRFRETQSVTLFVQQALNTFLGHALKIDGEFGEDTATALRDALDRLGIGDVTASVADWVRFAEWICDRGLEITADALDAKPLPARGSSAGIDEPLDWPDYMGEEEPVERAQIQTVRPDTGLLDLTYKPYPDWRIRLATTGTGKQQWFLDFNGQTNFYLGYRFAFDPYLGLARTGSTKTGNLFYDHLAYRPKFGEWASFVQPTGRCESEGSFFVVNAWDAAAMTLGFFQMAAHTGEHLASLFRDLLKTLPGEADTYFPELKLGSQIGLPEQGGFDHIYAVNGTQRLDLDVEAAPSDGLPAEKWYRGRFMRFFNPHRGQVDQEELHAAARWLAWLNASPQAREVCVSNAVEGAKRTVRDVHQYVLSRGHPRYPKGLDGVAMALVQAAMDVKHHGRRNRDMGQSNLQSIFWALTQTDPLAAFATIDTDWREERSRRSVTEIKAMAQWFDNKRYDRAAQEFK
ncbi:extensin family protein [Novosphingobium resinovorum]|uniref:Extensin-like C-terminal domain-containing protein n=1 Tax=Novosphingobium resinovorum TaxID=158500 RepID=A0A1D8A568_9SPHN|nr:extensin family protein [Novosphingobium resinovorum]AOR77273.1 hypothetical protein BES08_11330 [Novosphingobium resinovorum]